MIVKVNDLKNILNKIQTDDNAILCYDKIDGFKIKNTDTDLCIYEQELNSLSVEEEFLTIADIEKHIKLSKPTIIKLLNENGIKILNLNTFKIKKSDYLSLLNKYYL